MRRKDREIADIKDILSVIDRCRVFRIAVLDDEGLYIIPLNFGYAYDSDKLSFFFHSAKEGRKVEALKMNNIVAFEMDCEHRLLEGGDACSYGYAYRSIVGNARVSAISDLEEKKKALSALMRHQTGGDFAFDDNMAASVLVYKAEVLNFTGKQKL